MNDRFEITDSGIVWKIKPEEGAHRDEMEMSAFGVDFFVGYGIDAEGKMILSRYIVFPQLRTIPNDTHASFQCALETELIPQLQADGQREEDERAVFFAFDGVLTCESISESFRITRQFYPAAKARAGFEKITIKNIKTVPVTASLTKPEITLIHRGRGTKGVYRVEASHDFNGKILAPGESVTFYLCYSGRIANEPVPSPDGEQELQKRYNRISDFINTAQMESGNNLLDRMFDFARLRAGESIFATDGGLLHSPGGRAYYAATWCNDEVEYAGPWLVTTGDKAVIEASLNAYLQYIPFMDDDYTKIPSSVIAEGRDIWEGAMDRGDAAMYLYGASLFVLYSGSREILEKLWGAIQWCAEYCRRRTLPEGVIGSESDEQEGRFPTDGRANLSASVLCYGGLKKAATLAKEMGETALSAEYLKRADALAEAIEAYFGATLHGYDTYRYSKGFDTLRSWICLPLVMGLESRKEGTVEAMFSPYLWTEKGMYTCEPGDENPSDTIWDRAALYGFKGAFLAGKGDRVFTDLIHYCKMRLLGDRVPYPVEAWPEGNMRHLSGESALFCRIITEGMLGLEPTGMNSFAVTPRLPSELDHLHLKNIYLCGRKIDIIADRDNTSVYEGGKLLGKTSMGTRVEIIL